MSTGTTTSLKIENENTKVVGSFCLLGSTRTSSEEIHCKLTLNREAMKILEKIFRNCDVSLQYLQRPESCRQWFFSYVIPWK